MEIIINTEKFKKFLSAIQTICQKKTISDATQNAILEIENNNMILIKATDIEIYLEISLDALFIKKTTSIKKISINAKIIFDVIKEIDSEEITLSFSETLLEVSTGKTKVELNLIFNNNFPENELNTENILQIKNKDITEAISYCAHLSNSTIQRSGIGSIFYEIENNTFKATSTDGHCLAHIVFQRGIDYNTQSMNFLLSKRASSDIKRILEAIEEEQENIFIGKSANNIVFSTNHLSITVKRVNDRFPEYLKIINADYQNKIKCHRNNFLKITKRLSLFTEGKFLPATMRINSKKAILDFKIENNLIGRSHEEISINTEHNRSSDFEYNVFAPYLLRAATEMSPSENILIKSNESNKPILFEAEDGETGSRRIYVVMPMNKE